jgi:predicted DNA-binding transcriptional regulator AlpA
MKTSTATSRLQAPIVAPRGLNIRQASAYWGVSPGTFKTLIRRGQAPAPTKIPGLTRNIWDRHVLDAAMDAARDDAAA